MTFNDLPYEIITFIGNNLHPYDCIKLALSCTLAAKGVFNSANFAQMKRYNDVVKYIKNNIRYSCIVDKSAEWYSSIHSKLHICNRTICYKYSMSYMFNNSGIINEVLIIEQKGKRNTDNPLNIVLNHNGSRVIIWGQSIRGRVRISKD
jgi:hypothetical protein